LIGTWYQHELALEDHWANCMDDHEVQKKDNFRITLGMVKALILVIYPEFLRG